MTSITRTITITLVGWVSTIGTGTPVGGIPSLEAQEIGAQRAVLVTGATTGIGRKTAELLAKRGFFVYAGARKEQDMVELNAIENIQAIRLDVTIQEEIDAAVETVRAAGRGLYGLINNAGVAVIAPLIEVDEEDLRFQIDVNVYGPYRVTKAFAPLIIESEGRISSTGSLSGIVTWPLGGPYTMSKHAVEAFSEVLAAEMAGFGVEVSVVEPGNYNSRIFQNMTARYAERGYSTEGSLYQRQMEGILGRGENPREEPEPDAVAEAFLHALTDENPKRHYLVVPVQREAAITIQAAIRRLVQLNEGHEFSYDRDELIEFLDRALEGSR
jgi:NAD(P)-dependent dehydrogenase (short-subunit alcohol dehydrogenase family)